LGVTLLVGLALTTAAFGQGVQTGTIDGTVTLADGSPVPGVMVTASSPALQGQRTSYTSESGRYVIRNLPPGEYTLTYELEGMGTVRAAPPPFSVRSLL
jgi:hypothetical protein